MHYVGAGAVELQYYLVSMAIFEDITTPKYDATSL